MLNLVLHWLLLGRYKQISSHPRRALAVDQDKISPNFLLSFFWFSYLSWAFSTAFCSLPWDRESISRPCYLWYLATPCKSHDVIPISCPTVKFHVWKDCDWWKRPPGVQPLLAFPKITCGREGRVIARIPGRVFWSSPGRVYSSITIVKDLATNLLAQSSCHGNKNKVQEQHLVMTRAKSSNQSVDTLCNYWLVNS